MAIILTDPFLFGMYSVEVFLDFELLVFFLLRWKPRKTRHVAVLGLAYLCLGIARLLLMFWDYQEPVHSVSTARYYIAAAFFAFLAMAVFLHAAEALIVKTRHVATACFLGLAATLMFFPNEMYTTVQVIYYIFAPISILFVISFLFYLMSMTSGHVRKKFFVVFVGLTCYGTGYALSADLFNLPKGLSSSVVLVGLAMTALGFIEIPQLEEIHWHDYLLHVFTFHINTSACIYDESLGKKDTTDQGIAADLFSSGVTGIIGIIKEMIRSDKRLKVLDHEDKKILLEYGNHVTVALITRKDLDILHEKLRVYIHRVETDLQQPLERWRGEVSRFGPKMQAITADIFKTIIDKNLWKVDPRSIARQVKDFFKGFIPEDIIRPQGTKEGRKARATRDPDASITAGDATRPAFARAPAEVEPELDPWPAPGPSSAKPEAAVKLPGSPEPVLAPGSGPVPGPVPELVPHSSRSGDTASKPANPAMPAGGSTALATAGETGNAVGSESMVAPPPASQPASARPIKPVKKAPAKPAKPRATKPAPGGTAITPAPVAGVMRNTSDGTAEPKPSKPATMPATGKKKK
ncbi:MAG: hypothetical protein GYA24_21565 [Candidatus Lokiarchaeota archaeon]|nr:hypothetical protein [Candidatus Lokiarchaeota archaeon]